MTGNLLVPDLRTWIEAAVENTLTLQQLKALVGLCHSMAAVALRRKIAPVMLDTGVHGTNYRDLAYDCIAELFQQGEDGSLLQIRAYFQGIDREAASDQELLTHLRRIVFTKVNHGVVRFYGEADPDLGKILRNIKLSIQVLCNFTVVERFGDTFLLPAFSPPLEDLPPFGREELESELRKDARRDDHVPAMLAHRSRWIRVQPRTAMCCTSSTTGKPNSGVSDRGRRSSVATGSILTNSALTASMLATSPGRDTWRSWFSQMTFIHRRSYPVTMPEGNGWARSGTSDSFT